jgi:hypothetical protein
VSYFARSTRYTLAICLLRSLTRIRTIDITIACLRKGDKMMSRGGVAMISVLYPIREVSVDLGTDWDVLVDSIR